MARTKAELDSIRQQIKDILKEKPDTPVMEFRKMFNLSNNQAKCYMGLDCGTYKISKSTKENYTSDISKSDEVLQLEKANQKLTDYLAKAEEYISNIRYVLNSDAELAKTMRERLSSIKRLKIRNQMQEEIQAIRDKYEAELNEATDNALMW